MKKLGLIGGIGPESTISYYKNIAYGIQKRVGKPFFPSLIIESVNVFHVLEMCDRKEYENLTDYLLKGINNLAAGGADFAAMTGNTAHIVFDELKALSPIPLVSIIESACDETKGQGLTNIGLLGTKATMDGDFFIKPFSDNNINVFTPSEEEKAYIGEKIETELEFGIINQETFSGFMDIAERMVTENHIQAIVLGCTELPLLFKDAKLPVKSLNTMEIHINTLINMILE